MAESKIQRIKETCFASVREHQVFITIIVVYCLMVQGLGYIFNVADALNFKLYSFDLLINLKWFVCIFIIGHAVFVMVFVRPRKLLLYFFEAWRDTILQPRRVSNAIVVLLILPIFMSAFSSLKTIIPVINPYLWDQYFQEIDFALHGGIHPWQLVQILVHKPILSLIINVSYHFWYFVMNGILFWQVFSLANRQLRMQFLLSYLLLWALLGSIFALIFASVGPCYYGEITTGINPYQGLMSYLLEAKESYPLWALDVQKKLWEGYKLAEVTRGSGISAMPSMHVATSVLLALLGWRANKVLGIGLSLFGCVIVVGSVHLGWHYAIDGYVSIIMTLLIWKCVGWFLIRQEA